MTDNDKEVAAHPEDLDDDDDQYCYECGDALTVAEWFNSGGSDYAVCDDCRSLESI
jgi:hypothetical protein